MLTNSAVFQFQSRFSYLLSIKEICILTVEESEIACRIISNEQEFCGRSIPFGRHQSRLLISLGSVAKVGVHEGDIYCLGSRQAAKQISTVIN